MFSESRFFGFDGESKEYNAEAHRDRILGKHVADYMQQLKDEDETAYKRQFSKFIEVGYTPENVFLKLLVNIIFAFLVSWCLPKGTCCYSWKSSS